MTVVLLLDLTTKRSGCGMSRLSAETARLDGHTRRVSALCLLADGRLASGSHDRTVRLWNVATGFEVARLELDVPITSLVTVAPDRIVAGDSAGRVHWLEILD